MVISLPRASGVRVNQSCITPNPILGNGKRFLIHQSCDVDSWVKLAKEAGMQYVVFTTRHHDGFAMWPSKLAVYPKYLFGIGREIFVKGL